MTRPADLPDFEFPPVVEVALGVQFDPIGLQAKHLALLWEKWRDAFPTWEEQPPIPPVKEWFGLPASAAVNVLYDLGPLPQLRRALFINADSTELRQVQCDRFARNWRKAVSPYPRYDDEPNSEGSACGLRTRFRQDLTELTEFIREHRLGAFAPNQCEITYVNHVPTSGECAGRDLAEVLKPWSGAFTDDFLQAPESNEVALRFVISDEQRRNIGRLHIAAATARDRNSGSEVIRLTLTSRGLPLSHDVDGILQFMDIGRRWIVKGFASVTTEAMHRKWRRKNGS